MNQTISNDYAWINTILLGTAMFSLSIVTIVGNTIVIYAIRTDRNLRTVGNLFILSLATADLIVGCFVMPFAGVYAIMDQWKMGLALCRIWLSVDFTASTASIFNLLTLSLDRYWAITTPLQYLRKRTRTRALLLISFAWGLSLLWVIPIFGWNRFFPDGTHEIDSNKCVPGYLHSKAFKVTTAAINFYLPLLVLIGLNGRIYYEIKRRYKNELLKRYSNATAEPPTRRNTRTPVTINTNTRSICPTTNRANENDSLLMSKPLSIPTNENDRELQIHTCERSTIPTIAIYTDDSQRPSFKHINSFLTENQLLESEWISQRKWIRSSSSPAPPLILNDHDKSKHRLSVDERFFKRIDCSQNSIKIPPPSPPLLTTTTTLNIFNCCHCCSKSTSTINIHPDLRTYELPAVNRQFWTIFVCNQKRNSTISNISSRSNYTVDPHISHKGKQSVVWNQQEKAFRQLFAIVSGFTCCFLPYFILYMVIAFCDSCVSDRIITATIWLGYVNSTINPFLYVLSNEHYRRTFNRIFKREPRRQSI